MSHLLRIDASALHQGSFSKKLADHFQRIWTQAHPEGGITHHDLIDFEIPHIDERFIDAAYTHKEKRSAEQSRNLALSDRLVEELRETDTLLLSTPMYNFAIPSQLKAYLDHITRVGETFQYTENGSKGLLKLSRAVVLIASGGDYSQPPLDTMNFVKPYLKTILSFNGIDEVIFVEAAGMNMGDEKQQQSLQAAQEQIDALFE